MQPSDVTSTTITLPIDTTGLTVDAATVRFTFLWGGFHSDYLQLSDDGNHSNLDIMGNIFLKGDSLYTFNVGQLQFGGSSSLHSGTRFIGNIVQGDHQNEPLITNCDGVLVASNTILGVLGTSIAGGVSPTVKLSGTSASVRDNVNTGGYIMNTGSPVLTNLLDYTNNHRISVTSVGDLLPVSAGNVAAYEAYFVNPAREGINEVAPVGTIDEIRDAVLAMYTPTSGGPIDLALKPGSVGGAFEWDTMTYIDPTVTVPAKIASGQWSLSATGASGQAVITLTERINNNYGTFTAFQYSLDGGATVATASLSNLSYTATATAVVSGLTDGVAALVVVRLLNAAGAAPWSNSKSVTTTDGLFNFTNEPIYIGANSNTGQVSGGWTETSTTTAGNRGFAWAINATNGLLTVGTQYSMTCNVKSSVAGIAGSLRGAPNNALSAARPTIVTFTILTADVEQTVVGSFTPTDNSGGAGTAFIGALCNNVPVGTVLTVTDLRIVATA